MSTGPKAARGELRNRWQKMIKRCEVPTDDHYRHYGARGVTVCAAWHDFDVFSAWAFGAGWVPGARIIRRDKSGQFAPDNCAVEMAAVPGPAVRRVDLASSLANASPVVSVRGVSLPLRRWSYLLGVAPGVLASRIVESGFDGAGVVSSLLVEKCGARIS